MTLPDPNADTTSSKYNVQIGQAQGPVIGDTVHVEQHFYGQKDTRVPTKVPFMAPDLLPGHVDRPQELKKIKSSLLPGTGDRPTAITVALCGAGGYGKTTLATKLCHMTDIQNTFPDGILWVTLGEKPVNVVAKMEELVKLLSGEQLGLISVEAARTKLRDALAGRSCLLVIDDVWGSADLTPFLQGGPQCARLVTTRDDRVIPMHAVRIQVDAMNQNEAVQLLKTGLVSNTQALEPTFQRLAAQLGEWPLLLTLANGVLRRREQRGEPLQAALDHLQRDLKRRGVVAFDARNADARSEAVEKTIEVSLEQLTTDEAACYGELAIFPEDTSVPLSAVWRLWQTTAGWDDWKTENFCELLANLSLLHYDLKVGSILLHDVVRNYLQVKIGPHLSALHRQFLDSYGLRRWSDLSPKEPYLWYHLAEHLIAAEQREMLFATMKELGYLGRKALICGVSAIEQDLALAVDYLPNEKSLVLLRRHIVRNAHLLRQAQTLGEVEAVLLNDCSNIEDGGVLHQEWEREITGPYLTAWHPFPNPSSAALVRTLWGHTAEVNGCVISADGRLIVSASDDTTLKIWSTQTGRESLTLRGHILPVNGCAISADGRLIVSASDDTTLKVWDAQTGEESLTLRGHVLPVNGCVISADGRLIVSASDDTTLKVWSTQTGEELRTLSGHTERVRDCAIRADGNLIVSASSDKTLKIWDAQTGEELRTLSGHRAEQVLGCVISADGRLIVSASDDKTLKVWSTQTGEDRRTLSGHHAEVRGCAISADGRLIVSASHDKTLKIWDAQTAEDRRTISGHAFSVNGCAISADGSLIVSASFDKTLKVWSTQTGEELRTLSGHTERVRGCAISVDGRLIVSASDDQTLKVWEAQTGKERLTLLGHTAGVNGCVISADGRLIVSASHDQTLKVWDTQTGEERFTLLGHTKGVRGCVISADGRLIVSASSDMTLKVWEAQTGQEVRTLSGHTAGVRGCAISADGRLIVSASHDQTLKVWDTQTGEERCTLSGHRAEVNGCAISADGSLIVSASSDKTLKVWDSHQGSSITTLYTDDRFTSCVWHPDGIHLVATGVQGVYFLQMIQ